MDAQRRAQLDRLQEAIDAIGAETARGVCADAPDAGRGVGQGRRMRGTAPRRPDPSNDAPARKAALDKAYLRIVDLCSYHDFACRQMRERLLREGFPAASVDDALSRATAIGLIDDARWGEMRVCALMRKGMGCDGIRRELARYDIALEGIDGWPQAFEERYGDEMERALRMLGKGSSKSKNPRASAYARLIRKGFQPSVASRACAAWFETDV